MGAFGPPGWKRREGGLGVRGENMMASAVLYRRTVEILVGLHGRKPIVRSEIRGFWRPGFWRGRGSPARPQTGGNGA